MTTRDLALVMTGVLALGYMDLMREQAAASAAAPTPAVWTSFESRPSHDGQYRAAVLEAAGDVVRGEWASWLVEVTTPAGAPVESAAVEAEYWWVDGDGVRQPARVRAAGAGRYRVDGLRLEQAGQWNVPLRIAGAAGVDSLAFNIIVP